MSCRIAEVDEFIARLWGVHSAVKKEGYVQVQCLVSYGSVFTEECQRTSL